MNIYDRCVMLFLTIGVWVLVIYTINNGNKTKNFLWSIDSNTSAAYQVTQSIKDRGVPIFNRMRNGRVDPLAVDAN